MHDMVIYRDVPVRTLEKGAHVRKVGGRVYGCIHPYWGDIPVARYNDDTKKLEPVVNPRGYGYAGRNDLRNRRRIVKFR